MENKRIERQSRRTWYYRSRDKAQVANNVSLRVPPCYLSKRNYSLRTGSSIIMRLIPDWQLVYRQFFIDENISRDLFSLKFRIHKGWKLWRIPMYNFIIKCACNYRRKCRAKCRVLFLSLMIRIYTRKLVFANVVNAVNEFEKRRKSGRHRATNEQSRNMWKLIKVRVKDINVGVTNY